MIEPTDEMVAAFIAACWDGPDEHEAGEPERAGLAAVLAIVERDYRIEPRPPWERPAPDPCPFCSTGLANHCIWHPPIAQACGKCGLQLEPCDVCGKPSQCGDAWCVEHTPDGES